MMYICQPWISGVVEERTYIGGVLLTLPHSANVDGPYVSLLQSQRGTTRTQEKTSCRLIYPGPNRCQLLGPPSEACSFGRSGGPANKITAALLARPRRGAEARPI